MLKELVSATNPEKGTITYSYDGNGNLIQKVSGGVTTGYVYDAIDRLQERSYAGGNTQAVTWCYDGKVAGAADGSRVAGNGVANAVGRLTETSNSVSKTDITGYDAVGRVTTQSQTTAANTFAFGYQYNVAGSLTQMVLTVSSPEDIRKLPPHVTALKGNSLGDQEVVEIASLSSLRELDLSGCEDLITRSQRYIGYHPWKCWT